MIRLSHPEAPSARRELVLVIAFPDNGSPTHLWEWEAIIHFPSDTYRYPH